MGGPRHGPDFQNLHRNKRSITLNLKEPEGKAIFMKMVEKADVVVENYRADVKFRLGIDYESLKKVNPRSSSARSRASARTGPMPSAPASTRSPRAWAASCGSPATPGGGPVRAGIAVADVGAGLHCAIGILIALLEREKLGRGPVGVELAAAGDDLDVRLPGRALDARQGRAGPGRQQPSDRDPDRRLQDQRRLHQHRGLRRPHLQALLREHQGAGAADRRALLVGQGAGQAPRRAECGDRQADGGLRQRRGWSRS